MKKLSAVLLAAALAFPSTSFAATNGTLGTTSTGTIGLSLNGKGPTDSKVQITHLQDIAFGTVPDGVKAAPAGISLICVYLPTATTYTLNISSFHGFTPNRGGLVWMGGNVGHTIDYSWYFEDTNGGAGNTSNITGLTGNSVANCTSGVTASITLTPLNPVSSVNGQDQIYTDTLTLTVSPE